jgi:hypothetical protein
MSHKQLVFAVLLLVSFSFVVAQDDGKVLRLYGRDFSFQVTEPDGWMLNTRSAPQIANFIFHPRGVDWRRADSVIFARFVPRLEDETLEDFARQGREKFLAECPFADDRPPPLDLPPVDQFAFEVYHCPGIREEVVAVTAVRRFFVVFALSTQKEGALKEGFGALHQIASSFEWFESEGSKKKPN